MAIKHADEPGNCPEPSETPDEFMGGFCAYNFTSGPAAGKFCWDRQPEYSAYRESSFGHGILEVNEMSRVHCGFYSKDGGFIVSDDDKSFMQTCKVFVSTCTFGGEDDLYQPIGMSESSLQSVCYVAFWDEISLAAQEVAGHKVGEDHYIGKWGIVLVRNLPFSDQRLNASFLFEKRKMLSRESI